MNEIQNVNGHRVICGRCRHDDEVERVEGGVFDGPEALTYKCGNCSAVFGVCTRCAWFLADGLTCPKCLTDPAEILPTEEKRSMLPSHIKEADLVKDPAARADHWLHPKSGSVVKMPAGWKPKGFAPAVIGARHSVVDEILTHSETLIDEQLADREVDVPEGLSKEQKAILLAKSAGYGADDAEDEPEVEDLTGRKVIILGGRYAGKKGTISENGLGEDRQGLRVIEEGGLELLFEAWNDVDGNPYLRYMTEEEVGAADAEAASNKQAAKATRAAAAEKRAAKLSAEKAESGGVARG